MIEPDSERASPLEAHIVVPRTARYYLSGEPSPRVRELWIGLHGYGQLALDFACAMSPVASDDRLVVVPEALSRFYLSSPVRGGHATARVGATWMTREDRDAEIADQSSYLDAVHARVVEALPAAPQIARVLGFSQGVATAMRWLAHGGAHVDHLILWAGSLPDDIELDALAARHPHLHVTWVAGTLDEVVTRDNLTRGAAQVAALGSRGDHVAFEGGHRLDPSTLSRLAERVP